MSEMVTKTGLSRRTLLQLVSGAGAAVAAQRLGVREAGAAAPRSTLVVAANFDLKTLDPGRELEEGTNNVDHVTYDQLLTFAGDDLITRRPSLATGWKVSPDGKTYRFTLRRNIRFASGNPLTSADVKWSFERLISIKGNAAFFLNGVQEVSAPDPLTVVLRVGEPHPSILSVLASPALSVVDSKLVMQHGGDAGPNAKDKDTAEGYLNTASAGSGPYVLSRYVPGQEIVLDRNPNSWRRPAAFEHVVIRNIKEPATQALELKKGDVDIALALGPDQLRDLRNAPGVTVKTSRTANLVYVMMNNNPQVGGAFSNPKVQQAVRYALDYDGILKLAGPGAARMAGVIPTVFPGALPPSEANRTDVARAKQLLQEANAGELKGVLSFSSDLVFYGMHASLLAEKVQEDLAQVGIQIALNGLPAAIALQQYRDGKNQLGIWAWAAVYPDVGYYLAFVPGGTTAMRAGWPADASPQAAEAARLGHLAETEVDDAKRAERYRQWNRLIAQIGPWAPLFQPVVPYAFRSNLRGVAFATSWEVDYYAVERI